MRRFTKTLVIASSLMVLLLLAACGSVTTVSNTTTNKINTTTTSTVTKETTTQKQITPENEVDYAASVSLDFTNNRAKMSVTIRNFVDGDTTHFNVPDDQKNNFEDGVLKARYLAVNTPESTGNIEEWGKAASIFTKTCLSSAVEIIIESDTEEWVHDSSGGRYMSWVWYKKEGEDNYRNLNIELLQRGLAIASNSGNNSYGDTCLSAINQAKALKYCIYSGKKDPDFYYGDAKVVTLKELRINITDYLNVKVAFDATVIRTYNQGVYFEEYSEEDDIYYGFYAYYGFGASGDLLDILKIGNKVRVVGKVQYYETGGTYQVSGLEYDMWDEDNPNSCRLIQEGNANAEYPLLTASRYLENQTVYLEKEIINEETGEITIETQSKTATVAELSLNSSISMNNLYVESVYVTNKPGSDSNGAMTLTCKCDGKTITVRTEPLYDSNGTLIGADAYQGKTINVKGIIDYYSGSCQIKVFATYQITTQQ